MNHESKKRVVKCGRRVAAGDIIEQNVAGGWIRATVTDEAREYACLQPVHSGKKWRWIKTGRLPKVGDTVELFDIGEWIGLRRVRASNPKAFACGNTPRGYTLAEEGYRWRWPQAAEKSVPELPKLGDAVYALDSSSRRKLVVFDNQLLGERPGFKARDPGSDAPAFWVYYLDQEGAAWTRTPPADTPEAPKPAAPDAETLRAQHQPRLDAAAWAAVCGAGMLENADRLADNLCAIGHHVAAVRGQDRWGVGDIAAAFAGYKALPAMGASKPWWQILGFSEPPAVYEIVKVRWAVRIRECHPDRGSSGDPNKAAEMNAALDEAKRYYER